MMKSYQVNSDFKDNTLFGKPRQTIRLSIILRLADNTLTRILNRHLTPLTDLTAFIIRLNLGS